jgi:hypothetical protein
VALIKTRIHQPGSLALVLTVNLIGIDFVEIALAAQPLTHALKEPFHKS